jgi:hypothetical protein
VLDIAHKYRLAFPSLKKNIAVSRESRALSATVSSRPPRNPLMYIPRMLPHSYFPPRIYGVPRARLQPSRRCSPPSTGPTSPVFRPQVPRAGQNISSVSICASVAMVGIDGGYYWNKSCFSQHRPPHDFKKFQIDFYSSPFSIRDIQVKESCSGKQRLVRNRSPAKLSCTASISRCWC